MRATRIGCFAMALAAACPLRAETDLPAPAVFVASMELSIALCSKRSPDKASQYESVRPVANQMFAKRNYRSYVGTPEYSSTHDKMQAEARDMPEQELARHCDSLLLLLKVPNQGIVYYN